MTVRFYHNGFSTLERFTVNSTIGTSRKITSRVATADRQVMMRAMRAGLWIWLSFILLDAYMCFVAYPGAPFSLFVAYRIAIELAFFAVYWAARSGKNLKQLFYWQSLTYSAAALTIALMSVHLGGIRSPYMHGISIVALVWAVLVPTKWRRSLPTFFAIGISFPVVIAIGAWISPAAWAEWITAEALIVFASNYVFVLATSMLGLVLSHMVWSGQQKVRRLGSYKLEKLLGKGGMGEVWSAKHQLLSRQSAVKLILPEALGSDADQQEIVLARFEREAQVTASLRSPHTIEVYDFGVSDTGAFYYVMEMLEGLDAETLVEKFGPIPAPRAVNLLLQVCDSLGEAHEEGLVHRDIKPSNIYVCRYGRAVDFVKVLDFGLVKPRNALSAQLTAENSISGTPAFMSPEQVLGDKLIDSRADLYALGCVAYWLITGRYVFEDTNVMKIMLGHVHNTPEPPSSKTETQIPRQLEEVVMACLEKDPSDRPKNADLLAEALSDSIPNKSWTPELSYQWWNKYQPEAVSESDFSSDSTILINNDLTSVSQSEKLK